MTEKLRGGVDADVAESFEQKIADGQHIKCEEPHYRIMTTQDVHDMYEECFRYLNDSEEIDNVDWSRLDFTRYDVEYLMEKFPGFPDEFYPILSDLSKEEHKIHDYRMPPIRIDHADHILKFDSA